MGVDGGYPWIVPTVPTTIPTSVFIACVSLAWTPESVALGPANSTNKPDESAIHSMKEKQQ